jgi:hypothetical protein
LVIKPCYFGSRPDGARGIIAPLKGPGYLTGSWGLSAFKLYATAQVVEAVPWHSGTARLSRTRNLKNWPVASPSLARADDPRWRGLDLYLHECEKPIIKVGDEWHAVKRNAEPD